MLALTVAAIASAPVLAPTCAVVDVLRRRRRLPTLRTYLFFLQYLINDSVEILAAGPLWLLAGFGKGLDRPSSQRRHQGLQAWSIRILARRAQQFLGIRIQLNEFADSALGSGPAIVICRHVSLLDAALPALLYLRHDIHTSGVVMAELLADPGFDLLYQRAGSVFIPRDSAPEAVEVVNRLATNLPTGNVAVIFPEGRLFRRELLERSLTRMSERDPVRHDRMSQLKHLLPPRAGGFRTLLDALPDADVVVINHAGLDRYPAFADVARHAPLDKPIQVSVHRVPRAEIPVDAAARTEWLDTQWLAMDQWVDQTLQLR